MAFDYLQGWRLHNIPGQPMPVLSHPHRVFRVFQFVPVVSGPVPGNHWEESGSLFLHLPFRNSYTLMKFPMSFFFSRLKSPSSLSLSLYRARCSSPLIIFIALHWTFSSMCWNDSSKCNPGNTAQKMLTTVVFSPSLMLSYERMGPGNIVSNVVSKGRYGQLSKPSLLTRLGIPHKKKKILQHCSLQFPLIPDAG